MPKTSGLGELEREVMEYLWEHGAATGAQVREAVAEPRQLTDSTIRTVLRRLGAKGYLRRDVADGQYVYASVRGRGRVASDAVRNLLKSLCRGSLEELLTGLVDHRVVDSAELRRVAEKIASREKGRRK